MTVPDGQLVLWTGWGPEPAGVEPAEQLPERKRVADAVDLPDIDTYQPAA